MNINMHVSGLKYPASRKIYEKIDPKVEKWCKIIFFMNMKVCFPIGMSSEFIYSFILYFTTDLGNDAFQVPLPFWYVTDKQAC